MTNIPLTSHPDIQGLVFRGYPKLKQAGYGLFKITDRRLFQKALQKLVDQEQISLASHGNVGDDETSRLNIAFTAPGMKKMLAEGWLPETYDPAFVEGMVTDHRSRILGDTHVNAPDHWRWGNADQTLPDGVLMVFAHTKEVVDQLLAKQVSPENGCEMIEVIHGNMNSTKEHFGFEDGISQPVLKNSKRHIFLQQERAQEAHVQGIDNGEVILGYKDGSGRLPRTPATSSTSDKKDVLQPHPEWPERRDLGENGSYMVIRQLAQDVKGFWNYLDQAASGGGETAQELAEKMVGRRMDGRSMEPTERSEPMDNNLFDFDDDKEGLHCPIGSHIRRSNPRATGTPDPKGSLKVTERHRILRRGRVYGDPDKDEEVGLNFVCFNASISRQFEFIQSTWCNNQFFHGLQREVDPIIGTMCPATDVLESVDRFTIPRDPYRRLLSDLPTFVTVKGGGYFFMPGLNALKCLAEAP